MNSLTESIGRLGGARSSNAAGSVSASVAASRLRMLGNFAIITAVLIVPMTSASLQESGIALFLGASLILGLTWAIEQVMDGSGNSGLSGAEFIGLAAISLVMLQLIRIPDVLYSRIEPLFLQKYMPLWGTQTGQILGSDRWSSISLTPSLTRSGLVLLIGYVVFFLTLLQRLRSLDEVRTLLRLLAVTTAIMAVIGIAQLMTRSESFLWLFEHPFRTAAWPAKGAFSNQNHFAHFLALGIGPLFWLWHDLIPKQTAVIRSSTRTTGFGMMQSSESHLRWVQVGIAVVLLAAVLSLSRGGMASVGLACICAAPILAGAWRKYGKWAIAMAGFVVVSVIVFGTSELQERFATIREASSVQDLLAGRFALWSAIREALDAFWLTGSGLGSHAEVYPTWLREDFGVRFSHAESGYLQLFLEMGILGMFLLFAALSLCLFWFVQGWRRSDVEGRRLILAVAAGIIVSAVHSFVDFVWYIPGCMIITLCLIACLCRCWQLSSKQAEAKPVTRHRWPHCLAWTLILFMVPVARLSADIAGRNAESEHAWNQYRRHAISAGEGNSYETMESLDTQLDTIIMHLENCLERDPTDYRAASDLSAMYIRRFERRQQKAPNPFNTRELRNTVRSVEFESTREIAAWLKISVGENVADLYRGYTLARRALHGQPLRGETYLILAEVGFLAGLTEEQEEALLKQALLLRPHKAAVLYVAGVSMVENGDLEKAMVLWKRAFKKDKAVRKTIVQGLAPYLSAEDILAELEPDLHGLAIMLTEFRNLEKEKELNVLFEYFQPRFESWLNAEDREPGFWKMSYELFVVGGKAQMAHTCLENAVNDVPNNYELRRKFAFSLLKNKQFQEARTQLKWCIARKPDDREIAKTLKSLRIEQQNEVNSAE